MSMDQDTLDTAAVKPRNRWRHFLLIWAVLLLLIGLIGCILLWLCQLLFPEKRSE